MLNYKISLLLFFSLLQYGNLMAQQLVMEGPWKVSFDDKKEFSQAGWDDKNWEELKVLKWSDDRRTTANRTLWIRKTMVIPSSLKTAFDKTGLVALSMGKILQSDDTYLNGKPIGSTGSGDSYRNYLISKEDILWDKENTVAIRVRHWGQFAVSAIPKFGAASPEDFFSYASGLNAGDKKVPVLQKNLIYQLTVTNKSPKPATGKVTADFYNFEGKKLYTATKDVQVAVGKNNVDFPYTSPSPFLKIVYSLSVPSYQYQHEWNGEFGYQDIAYKHTSPVVAYKAGQKYFPADLSGQKISGWLGDRLKANTEKRLYNVDEEALLAGFINRPGSHSWIGEHIGKFLDAACNVYANTSDPALKIQIDRSAQQLMAAQLPDGYLGTYDRDSHWTSWDVWSHRYDLIGLLHYYELSGFKPALKTSQKIGDLLIQTFGTEKGQREIVKAGGHVGMAATCILESMVELYRFSGEKKYLDFCYYVIKSFDANGGPRIISTLDSAGRVDKVANAKAYEMMSNFLGIIKLYRLTNDEQFLAPLLTAWTDIVANRLYITGTASSFEHFQDDDVLPATDKDNMGEGCVTTTWIQFTYQLFCVTAQMKYLDELERSVYNHLTGAENPETGAVSYYTPLIGIKPYRSVITCCMSSVPRGIAMIPLFANGKINNTPAFLFYQPGTYATTVSGAGKASFTTATNFPADGAVKITVDETPSSTYTLAFRKPYWAGDFTMSINGEKQAVTTAETITVKRAWKKGDVIDINFLMPLLVLNGGKTYPDKIALQRGPQVLAFDKTLNGVEVADVSIGMKNSLVPATSTLLPKTWVGNESFTIKAAVNSKEKDIILVPYADAGQTGGAISTWITKEK